MTTARIAAVLFAIGLIWTVWLFLAGGVDLDLFGFRVTSNNPSRPLVLTLLAGVVYLRVAGVQATERRLMAAFGRISTRTYAWLLAAGAVAIGVLYATTAASASDPHGYVSQAELWLQRTPTIAQPWVAELPWPNAEWSAAPLGYRPLEDPARPGVIVPTYAPGVPMLMALGKLIGGQGGLFAIVPLLGGVLLLATYGIGARVGQPRRGLIAAWLVATSPVFLFFVMVPMSDVAAAALWAASFYFVLGSTRSSAALGGLVAALAILVRPNLVFLAPIFALRFNIWTADSRRRELTRAALYVGGSAVGVVATALVFRALYGSATTSGYGSLADQFDPARLIPNLKNYTSWLFDLALVPAVIGTIASALPLRRLWRGAPEPLGRVAIALAVVTVWVHYCGYLVFDDNLYLRFLLPTWPFVMLALAEILLALARVRFAGAPLVVASLVLILGVLGIERARRRGAFDIWAVDRQAIAAALVVNERTPENAVVLGVQHSGSVRYYAGRRTIRYDQIPAEWLDRSIDWLAAKGHSVYALLDDWEVARVKERFAGQHLAGQFENPEWTYVGLGRVTMFCLTPTATTRYGQVIREPTASDVRAWPPSATPFGVR